VVISPFHQKYFADQYQIKGTTVIDLPVRTWEYGTNLEKVPNRLIFTSVPDRGLWQVAKILPKIREIVPDVSLVITSDYRLWGIQSPNNQQFLQAFIRQPNVEFLGAVPRERLIQEQQKAQIHLYPFSKATAEELFCIAVAESQVASTLPITTCDGALETTNMGILIDGNANDTSTQDAFAKKVSEYLGNPELPSIQASLRDKAIERFSIENVLKQWNEKVFYDC
jgi:glycosyltransferase involved in cell wall biosynthesis